MSDQPPIALEIGAGEPEAEEPGALEVFRNRPFLLLWLSQLFTQIGGNMVLYGLTVIVLTATGSNTAVRTEMRGAIVQLTAGGSAMPVRHAAARTGWR